MLPDGTPLRPFTEAMLAEFVAKGIVTAADQALITRLRSLAARIDASVEAGEPFAVTWAHAEQYNACLDVLTPRCRVA